MNQRELNTFKRKYFNLGKKRRPNAIIHDPNTCKEHRLIVLGICEWLTERKFTFYTRVYTNIGEIVDIVAPDLPKPFIEVRHSELDKKKQYSEEYDHLRTFVDTTDPYKLL